ncbi:MAG TPA: hypothetical protein VIJ22_17915 [Polyangiaceae bacterium]
MTAERDRFWQRAFAALVGIAKGWTGNVADREDLAQRALTEAWMATPERPTPRRWSGERRGS